MSKPAKSTPKKSAASNGHINATVVRETILQEAERLITGDRQLDYGDPRINFDAIATGWEVIFGTNITAHQVCLAMIWLKTCRAVNGQGSRDSWVDIAGYAGLAEYLTGV